MLPCDDVLLLEKLLLVSLSLRLLTVLSALRSVSLSFLLLVSVSVLLSISLSLLVSILESESFLSVSEFEVLTVLVSEFSSLLYISELSLSSLIKSILIVTTLLGLTFIPGARICETTTPSERLFSEM